MMDHLYKEKMSQADCEKLVLQAVTQVGEGERFSRCNDVGSFFSFFFCQAIRRDGSSGGVARLAIITKDGVERKLWLNNELPTTF